MLNVVDYRRRLAIVHQEVDALMALGPSPMATHKLLGAGSGSLSDC